ncbi:hypothetical protein NC652_016353 [Populus alba x Populus x berolinensis]|uniref:Uncharacterized protein n=1 Tax=Populus alba x Populus x berolinensis TaxID=444605 RepID=A0AAD6QJW0_9ROSI|nr:hypothetical protein NC652_016353 [Populus alba x Populus x berolinensis]KAJ6991738.1 hypothetical protein NC653_015158 [Populus alba x Populus x berolinensis]
MLFEPISIFFFPFQIKQHSSFFFQSLHRPSSLLSLYLFLVSIKSQKCFIHSSRYALFNTFLSMVKPYSSLQAMPNGYPNDAQWNSRSQRHPPHPPHQSNPQPGNYNHNHMIFLLIFLVCINEYTKCYQLIG